MSEFDNWFIDNYGPNWQSKYSYEVYERSKEAWLAAIDKAEKICQDKYEMMASLGFPREASTARRLVENMKELAK